MEFIVPKYRYNKLVKFNTNFLGSRADMLPISPELERFSEYLWSGNDEGIWCVYRRDPRTKEVVRIEFFAPINKKRL